MIMNGVKEPDLNMVLKLILSMSADVLPVRHVVMIILLDSKKSGTHNSTYVVKVLTLPFLLDQKIMQEKMASVVFVEHQINFGLRA